MVKRVILSVKNLIKTYGDGRAKTFAVRGVSFDIREGEFVALSGPSGSGKSTTFHQIAILDNPTSGVIKIGEQDLNKITDEQKAMIRLNKIGYVFQHYGLLPELTALENIYLPLMVEEGSNGDIVKKAEKVLEQVGLLDRKDHYPSELSGGEQQRISIARAIVKKPDLILADEPTANLDTLAGKKIMELLKELNKKMGITVFIINHEREFEKYFDRIIKLRDGKIEQDNGR
jgi:putative ABC transport system ATP-binding protein